MTDWILLLCSICACSTAAICLASRPLGEWAGLMDRPDRIRKLHAVDTPLTGGIAVLFPVALATAGFLLSVHFEQYLLTATGASAALLVLGALDDRYGLKVAPRFLIFTAIVLIAFAVDPLFVIHTLRLELLELEVPLAPFGWLTTLIMVIGFVNAVNMADGMNGQFLGTVALWSIFILFYIEPALAAPYAALATSAAVALVFNVRGRLFSGSAGSYAISLFIGLSAIALYRGSNGAFPAEIPVFWFWLPVADCVRLFAWRMWSGRSPFSADREHFHHILMGSLRPHNALAVYLALLAAPGIAALIDQEAAVAALFLCLALYGLLLAFCRLHRGAAFSRKA